MSRLPYGKRRALTGLVAVGLFAGAVPALAQTPTPEPKIDSAPAEVNYGRTAVIEGHLENGTPGQEVLLQQRREGLKWRTIAIEAVDRESEVTFRREGLHKTSDFRLAWEDEVTAVRTYSKVVTTKVRSKLTLKVNPDDTYIGRTVTLSGTLLPKVEGRRVILQQKVEGEWRHIDRVMVGDGRFSTSLKARHKGFRKVRAIFRGDPLNSSVRERDPLTIYRRDLATWYGPGFYGNSTACGKTLTTETLGVAHRTLPCGTMVSILFNGETITVPVIDRGPYSAANWDLTQETAERLGFSGSQEIGVTR